MRLTKEQQLNLIWLYQATLDNSYIEELLRGFDDYMWAMIHRTHKFYNGRVPKEDLYQECVIGLIKGVRNFELDKKDIFPLGYLVLWMKSAMFHRFTQSLPVHISSNRIREVMYPTAEKPRPEAIEYLRNVMASVTPLHLLNDDTLSKDYKIAFAECRDFTVEQFERLDLPEQYEQMLDDLILKHRLVFELRANFRPNTPYYPFSEISQELGMSEQDARGVYHAARRRLKQLATGTVKYHHRDS